MDTQRANRLENVIKIGMNKYATRSEVVHCAERGDRMDSRRYRHDNKLIPEEDTQRNVTIALFLRILSHY